ncbi:hypothetical protein ACFLT5_03805 [Chloroflexota bacterium]
MSSILLLLILGLASLLLIGLFAGGALLLIRLGVIAHYSLKPEEPPGSDDFSLDQSTEAGD